MFKKFASLDVQVVSKKDSFSKRSYARRIVEYDPEYVYVVVRALTADRPNSNGDCFPHSELVRIDPLLKRPVYASFIGKGVYVNHQGTDDPRQAKGIVLDARYVQSDSNDKYVELLLGIDKNKDPVFAQGVERGLINKYSMGASVQFTRCSVCGNEARKKEDFCEHIAKHKMRPVKTKDGTKLAYELCYGVTYTEISAVTDPADETAQLLAKIARTDRNKSMENVENVFPTHGTVTLLNDIKSRLEKLEASMRKVAEDKVTDFGTDRKPDTSPDVATDTLLSDESDLEEDKDLSPSDDGSAVDVLKIVEDLLSKKITPEEAVKALEDVTGESAESADVDSEEAVEEDVDVTEDGDKEDADSLFPSSEKLSASRKDKKDKKTKKGERDSEIKSQYPEFDVDCPKLKQYPNPQHDSTHKKRPAKDFEKDVKEYSDLTNISAEFIPNHDRRLAGWRISDGDTPIYMVTGGNAWGEYLDEMWDRFASREYGEDLIRAILDNGLANTMRRVNAIHVSDGLKRAESAPVLDERLLQAAEKKAADMAQEMADDFRIRFVEALKLAFKLQDKNVLDNPIRGAAWEVLTGAGLDGRLAEQIAPAKVVEAHFDEALRKALEYTEMSPEAFEEVKAQAETMAGRLTYSSNDTTDEVEKSAREYLARRVAQNVGGLNLMTPGELPSKNFDEALSAAIRSGKNSVIAPPSKPLDQSISRNRTK